jgi:AcrR family transcriptional regulator
MAAPLSAPSKEDVVAEFRRRSIIQAACHVFGEKGFEQATVDAIAEAAHVAKGTVYLYYPSKQAIYDAVFASGMADLERLIGERVAAAGSAREAIAAFVTVRAEYFLQHPDFFRVYVAEFARHVAGAPESRGACQLALDRQTRALQRVMEKAVAAGEVRPVDPEAAAMAVFDVSKGLIGRRLMLGGRAGIHKDITFLTDLIWSGLKPARGQKK